MRDDCCILFRMYELIKRLLVRGLTNNTFVAGSMFVLLCVGFFVPEAYASIWRDTVILAVVVGSLPFVFQTIASLRRRIFSVDIIAILAIVAALFTHEIIAAG